MAQLHSLTGGLGATSMILGASELIAPDTVTALTGVTPTRRTKSVVRALGMRECGHGAAVLWGSPRLMWTRVAGDVLDVAVLAKGLAAPGSYRRRGAVALAFLAVVGIIDVYAAVMEAGRRG